MIQAFEVKQAGNGLYEVQVGQDSDFGKEVLSDMDTDKIPENLIGTYPVVAPKDLELYDTTAFFTGEDITKLSAVTSIGANKYQEELATYPKIKVAVIDSGVNANHEDLQGNIDPNGGYDYIDQDTLPQDDNGHGTHITGILGARVNGKGVF